jgi:hypothetical protein
VEVERDGRSAVQRRRRERARAPGDPSRIGQVYGGYVIREQLGAGGFGKVYRAEPVAGGEAVALKVAENAEALARLEREFSATHGWQHAHVVRALDEGKDRGVAFLVLELVRGRDCASLVQTQRRALRVERALPLVAAACRGLAAVHARGWVHRDVTPANILVGDRDRIVKLADFGIARPVADVPKHFDLTQAHLTIGTPQYMSPEQWATPKTVTPASDLFMLAGCLYFLLRAKPPFDSAGSTAKDFPVDVDATPEVRALLARAGRRDPEQRFQSAAEMLAALEACRACLPTVVLRPPATKKPKMTTDQLPRTTRLSLAAIEAAGLVFDPALGAYRSDLGYVVVQERAGATFALDKIPELSMREMAGARVRVDETTVTLASGYFQTLVVEVDGKAQGSRVYRPREPMEWSAALFANVFFSARSGAPEWGCSVERVRGLTLPTIKLVGLTGVRLTFRSLANAHTLCTVFVVAATPAQSKEDGAV